MKARQLVFAAAAAAAFSSTTLAQSYRLDLYLVARQVSGMPGAEVITDFGVRQDTRETVRPQTPTGNVVNADVGKHYRVELRYRIADLVADTSGSRGLSSANIRFDVTSTGLPPSDMRRSRLTNHQAGQATILTTDSTGLVEADPVFGDTTGLIGEFRGGLTSDNDVVPNGVPNPSGWSIVPLALSAPNHNSWRTTPTSGPNPSASNTDANGGLWSIYTIDFMYQGGTLRFDAEAIADQTTNRFGYFIRPSNVIPQTSTLATPGMITFIPSPSAAALLAIAGLVTSRRRRSP